MTRNVHTATWLILPVVICLSQGLSHACLSRSPPPAGETANGSVQQSQFTGWSWPSRITVVILELIRAPELRLPPSFASRRAAVLWGRSAFISSKPTGLSACIKPPSGPRASARGGSCGGARAARLSVKRKNWPIARRHHAPATRPSSVCLISFRR